MHMNRQIEKLFLILGLGDYNDYDLIFSSINEILLQLKKLCIDVCYNRESDGQISNYHFDKIDTFGFSGYSSEMEKLT